MEGGCCIARYGGGGGAGGGGNNYGVYNMSQVDRIMLRFRPIAPKPASVSCSSPESKDTSVSSGRPRKRRYVRNNNNNSTNGKTNCNNKRTRRGRKAASSPSSSSSPTSSTDKRSEAMASKPVVTLPLLSDAPAETPTSHAVPFSSDLFFSGRKPQQNIPLWLNFNTSNVTGGEMVNQRTVPALNPNPNPNGSNNPCLPKVVVVVSLTLECMTETWTDLNVLGCTDEEKRRNLEGDTCPGFVTDCLKRVTWTNPAFRNMVARRRVGVEGVEGMIVRLGVKEGVALGGLAMCCPGFTCSVRMQYTCGNGKDKTSHTQILPCDVWRMDGGGLLAWRLDVRAALSLGLGV